MNELPQYEGLLQKNLVGVFGERDPDRRLAVIREVYAEDAVLYEPHAVAKGHAQISSAVGKLLGQLPADATFHASGPVVGHHGVARLQWKSGPNDGAGAVTGTDVAQFENGRIRSLHVFLDSSPTSAPVVRGDDVTAQNKATLLAANAAISQLDIESFLSHFAEDVKWSMVGDSAIQGKRAVREWLTATYAKPPLFDVSALVAEGDVVVAMGEISVLDKNGAATPARYCDVWRFRDGRIAELQAYVIT